jgi:polyferredoxin
MPTVSRSDEMLGAIAVIILLIGTATGSAYVMLGMAATALTLFAVFYRGKIGRGAILVAFVAAITAAVIGIVAAIQ